MLDLLSPLSPSPGGETGFDRLAAGFHALVPVLTQALIDELNVLSGLAEPHAVLGFLSAAYLSTVARELTSLMEKECEMALRDNTSSHKVKKHSAKCPATVGRCLLWSTTFTSFPVLCLPSKSDHLPVPVTVNILDDKLDSSGTNGDSVTVIKHPVMLYTVTRKEPRPSCAVSLLILYSSPYFLCLLYFGLFTIAEGKASQQGKKGGEKNNNNQIKCKL